MNNLPQGWGECEFDKVCNIYTGNSINEKEKAEKFTNIEEGYSYIATKDISNTHSIDYENGVKIPFGLSKYRIAPQNTSLLCIEGGSAGKKLGFAEQDVCFVNKLCAFVPFDMSINSKFIYYYLQSKKFANYFNSNKTGLIGGVSIQKLKNIVIVIPPDNAQKRIVDKIEEEFEKIDEGIEKLKLVQEQIKQYKQSLLLSKYGKATKFKRIGDICDVVRGGSPRPAGDERFYNGSIPFLKVADLTNNEGKFLENYTYTIKEAGLYKTRQVQEMTLLLSNSGATLGIPKICTFKTTFNDGIAAFLNLPKECINYHYYYWLSKTEKLRNINRGAAQPNLNTDLIKEQLIPDISLEEQKTIVEEIEKRFEVADKVAKIVEENLKKAEQLKQSILKEAFEGRLVPQDPTDEQASVLLEKISKESNNKKLIQILLFYSLQPIVLLSRK